MFKAVSLLAIIVGVTSAVTDKPLKAGPFKHDVHHHLKAKSLAGGPQPQQSCNVPNLNWVGDGYCDPYPYNTAACGWDGGDCCECTCTDGDYTCGVVGYDCLDPNASAPPCDVPPLQNCEEVSDFAALCSAIAPGMVPACIYMTPVIAGDECDVPIPDYIGDGYCDGGAYNTDACGWDGGDCCVCTCTDDDYTCGSNGYNCLDPDVPPNCSGGVGECNVPIPDWVGDGYCDGPPYNTAACNWDGGDCCPLTCTDGAYTCGTNGYNCLDPTPS